MNIGYALLLLKLSGFNGGPCIGIKRGPCEESQGISWGAVSELLVKICQYLPWGVIRRSYWLRQYY